MKTLIITAHPHIAQSVVNKCWLDELAKHPDRFTVHRLYTAYPDGKNSVQRQSIKDLAPNFRVTAIDPRDQTVEANESVDEHRIISLQCACTHSRCAERTRFFASVTRR